MDKKVTHCPSNGDYVVRITMLGYDSLVLLVSIPFFKEGRKGG